MRSKVIIRAPEIPFTGIYEEWQIPVESWSFSEELNKGTAATIKISAAAVDSVAASVGDTVEFMLQGAYREVYIYDDGGRLIYGGVLWELSTNEDAQAKATYTISVKGFEALLSKRITHKPSESMTKVYSAQYATTIISDLVTYTQGLGSLGLTIGSMPNDQVNDRTYRFDKILTAIQKLSNDETSGGIDWEITARKVVNAYYPQKGSQRQDIHLYRRLNQQSNIQSYDITHLSTGSIVNEVVAIGQGQDLAPTSTQSDAPSQASYLLLQDTLSESGVITTGTLDKKATKYLELMKYPRDRITITAEYDRIKPYNFGIGDSLRIEIERKQIDNYYRLRKRTINDTGQVTLSFSEL